MDPMIALPAYQKPIGVIIPGPMLYQSRRQTPAEHPAGDLGFTTCRSLERPRRPYRCQNVHAGFHSLRRVFTIEHLILSTYTFRGAYILNTNIWMG